MNQSMRFQARRPLATAAVAALLLNGAALASLSRLPTRGERLLAVADTQAFAELAQQPATGMYPAAMAGHTSLHDRLERLAQRWLSLGGKPATVHGPV